jgi:hypothetical protein
MNVFVGVHRQQVYAASRDRELLRPGSNRSGKVATFRPSAKGDREIVDPLQPALELLSRRRNLTVFRGTLVTVDHRACTGHQPGLLNVFGIGNFRPETFESPSPNGRTHTWH